MKKNISTIEELVLAIQENNKVGNMEIICPEGLELSYKGDEPLMISKPLKLVGNHSSLVGNGNQCFLIHSSDVEIVDFCFRNFNSSIAVDGYGDSIQNIGVRNCSFNEVGMYAIEVVSTKSNSKISKVCIEDNTFLGAEGSDMGEKNGIKIFLALGGGKTNDGVEVINTELSDVLVARNHTEGEHRMSIYLCGALLDARVAQNPKAISTVVSPVIRNVKIMENVLHGGWDGSICLSAGFAIQKNSLVEYIDIENNDITFGLWGMIITSIVPLYGLADTGKLKDIRILDNKIVGNPHANPQFYGEIQNAIGCVGARSAAIPHVHCKNIGIEKIQIKGNDIRSCDRGIFVMGEDLVLDAEDTSIQNCYVKDIEIINNKLNDVKDAFTFTGGYAEGEQAHRLTESGEADNVTRTYVCEGNYIENIVCENNYIKDNLYKYKIYGVMAHGHGSVKNNKIINARIGKNIFEKTKGHIHLADTFIDGWCDDQGGNLVEKEMKDSL